MPCGLGLPLAQCIAKHWCPPLNGDRVGNHWRATCPVCWKPNFEITLDGSIRWNCHTKDEDEEYTCDHADIRYMLARLIPCRKGNSRVVPRSELEKLLGLNGAALRLRVACLAWDCSPEVAAQRLKMPERTYRRARTARPDLAKDRRSESGDAA